MHALKEITAWLDTELAVREIVDYPNAKNGLQLENSGKVTKLAVAVDASEGTIREAVLAGADLLIVHHGLFWSGLQPHTGANYRKLKLAIENNLAIYSCHLPLDVHESLGNNIGFARALGLENLEPALNLNGLDSGLVGTFDGSWRELVEECKRILKNPTLLNWGFGPNPSRVLICTGGAGGEIAQAAKECDTFISGEGAHWTVPMAEEFGINLIYGGHYLTETFGVKSLGRVLHERFGLDWSFIDRPTKL